MAENASQPESHPQSTQSAPFHFSANNSPLSMVAPSAQHPPSTFHYPHAYIDHLAAAAASAFYQHHRQQQPQSSVQSQQHINSQPLQHSIPTSASQQTSQPIPSAHQSQSVPPYYLQDHAGITAVALQQMQLQMQLQLQAQQQQPSSSAQQPSLHEVRVQHSAPLSSHQMPSAQVGASAIAPPISLPHPTLQPPPPRVIANGNPMSNVPNGSMDMPSPMPSHIPFVPDAQMASAYRIGRYTPAERRIRLERYREKRLQRNYNRRVKYDCRKMIADKRRRVQGRFVKREEEVALAAQQEKAANGVEEQSNKLEEVGNGTDGTEDETKVHNQLESSGSSGHVLESMTLNGRGVDEGGECVGSDGADTVNFSEQSDQVLQFR